MILKFKANNNSKDSILSFKKYNYSLDEISNNSTIKKKNLILGVIKQYKWEVVAPFFISFKKAGFNNCDCVIFVEDITNETINIIKNFNVTVIKIKKIIQANIINYRYKLYEDYLRNNLDKYKLVLAIDIRDSFFQEDIFKYYQNNKSFLLLTMEDDYLTQGTNKIWLIHAFGNNIYKTIENERIICSGTILGSANKFLEFTSMIWKTANTNNISRDTWNDQAIVNYLVYHKLFLHDSIVKNQNKDSLILTLACANKSNFLIDPEDNILNGKGEIAPVIHQYDRHSNIVIKVLNKYCPELLKNKRNNIAMLKRGDIAKTKAYIFIIFIVILLKFIKIINYKYKDKDRKIKFIFLVKKAGGSLYNICFK